MQVIMIVGLHNGQKSKMGIMSTFKQLPDWKESPQTIADYAEHSCNMMPEQIVLYPSLEEARLDDGNFECPHGKRIWELEKL